MTCGVPKSDSWVILREPVGSDMPWPGFIFGQTPASIWYWCADQVSNFHLTFIKWYIYIYIIYIYSEKGRASILPCFRFYLDYGTESIIS